MPRPSDVGVGVAVVLVCEEHVLLGQRKGAHGAGEWCLPGGWIDRADASIEAACVREVREETGLLIEKTERLLETMVDYPDHGFASITLFRVASKQRAALSEAELREPDKCLGWHWFLLDHLPSPLFAGVAEAIGALRRLAGADYLLRLVPPLFGRPQSLQTARAMRCARVRILPRHPEDIRAHPRVRVIEKDASGFTIVEADLAEGESVCWRCGTTAMDPVGNLQVCPTCGRDFND